MGALNSRQMRCIITLILSHVGYSWLKYRGLFDGCEQFFGGEQPAPHFHLFCEVSNNSEISSDSPSFDTESAGSSSVL